MRDDFFLCFSIVLLLGICIIGTLSVRADDCFTNFENNMFKKLITFIAGDYNQKQINKLLPLIKQINDFSDQFDALSDDQIQAKTQEFKDRLTKGETLDDLLPEAFATVKQACKRMC